MKLNFFGKTKNQRKNFFSLLWLRWNFFLLSFFCNFFEKLFFQIFKRASSALIFVDFYSSSQIFNSVLSFLFSLVKFFYLFAHLLFFIQIDLFQNSIGFLLDWNFLFEIFQLVIFFFQALFQLLVFLNFGIQLLL